ncbi:MAG: hypothetical protein OXC37_04480 [Bdellovibrionaceae bacterium]|nr:hypothetical protein [Pseudobdellovibrionaceae bacterium]
MIVSHLYEYLPLLEGNYLSEKETKNYILQTEKLIQLMEENSIKTYKRFEILEPYLTPALKKTSQIIYFMQSKQNELNEKYEYLDTKTILNLILSTLSQHLYTYLTHPQSKNLDWSRLRIILESISQFNSEQPAFSLYKIYRSVREKYSLKEYINCN